MTDVHAVGDIVAFHTGIAWSSVLGVVVRSSDRFVKLTTDGSDRVTFQKTKDGWRRQFKPGQRIYALDASTRQRMLAEGFSFGPCSRRSLEDMEAQARRLREAMSADDRDEVVGPVTECEARRKQNG